MSTMGFVSTLNGAEDAASLNLNFTNQRYKVGGVSKTFSDLITFNRPSTAGRWNAKGVYEILQNDQPRFDYDPLTKVMKGLLIEDGRTNLATYSNESNTLTPTRASYVDVGQLFIDGSTPMRLLREDNSAANTHFATPPAVTAAASTTYTGSYFIKPAGRTKLRLNVQTTASWNPSNPQVTFDTVAMTAVGAFGATGTIKDMGNGIYRITMTAVTGAASFTTSMYPTLLDNTGAASYNGDGVSGMYIGGYQFEAGAFETSYIPTPVNFVSRSSIGTYFDNKGVLQTAPVNVARNNYNPSTKVATGLLYEAAATNLFTGSDQLQLMTVNSSATVRENYVVAPDGTQTADTINMAALASSGVYRQIDTASSTQKTFSAFLKLVSGGDSLVQLRCEGTAFAAANNANFDLSLGTISSVTGAAVATIEPINDGWYRCSVTAPTTGSGTQTLTLYSGTTNAKVIAAWGIQVEAGTVMTSYVPTPVSFSTRTTSATYFDSTGVMQTAPSSVARYDYNPATKVSKGLLIEGARTNDITYSDNMQPFDWNLTAATMVVNTAMAPDGTLTASKLIEDTATTLHYVFKSSVSGTVAGDTTYTISCYAKAAERSRMRLVGVVAAASATKSAIFDLATGTVVSVDTGGGISDVRCEPVGNGWYRCSAVITVTTGNTITPRVYYQTVISGTTFSYQGDGVSGIHLWGPQLEVGSSLTSYIPTLTNFTSRSSTATYLDQNGLMRTAAINVARTNAYKHDDNNVLQPVGTLTERASATNRVRYSTEYTNSLWTKGAGITLSTDGSTAPDGSVAQKFTLSGATSHEISIPLLSALTVGTTYTLSVWLKPIGAVVPSFQLGYYDGGVSVSNGTASNQVVGQWKRYSFTFTPSSVAASPRCRLIGFSGGLDGNSFYMFNPQLEAGTYATSDITTVASEVTRSADVTASTATTRASDVYTSPTVTRAADVVTSAATARAGEFASVNNLTPWFNQTEGTLVTEFLQTSPLVASTFRRPATLSALATGEVGYYVNGTTGNIQGYIHNGTATVMDQIATGAPVYVPGEIRTAALAYKLNDCAFSTKGFIGTDTSVTLPTIGTLYVGAGNSGGNRMNAHIRSVNYYGRRMTNSEVQVIAL